MTQWKELSSEKYRIEMQSINGRYKVLMKWDGCIDLRVIHNSTYNDPDERDIEEEGYVHICDLKGLIDGLNEIYEIGLKRFPVEWNDPEWLAKREVGK